MNEKTDVNVLPTPAPSICTAITQNTTQADTKLKQSVYQEFHEATGKNFKVMGETTSMNIDWTGEPKVTNLAEDDDATTDVKVSVVWTFINFVSIHVRHLSIVVLGIRKC